MSATSNTKNKVLVPLATLLVAGAVAVGSGASFTSQSAHTVAVTSGTLKHTNDHDGGVLQVTNIKPGDTRTGTLTLTNDGDLDSTLSLQETDATPRSGFEAGALKLKITKDGVEKPLFEGDFGSLDDNTKLDLGALNAGQSTTVNFVVSMPASAGNGNQGKAAGATYTYVTTQLEGEDKGVLGWIKKP